MSSPFQARARHWQDGRSVAPQPPFVFGPAALEMAARQPDIGTIALPLGKIGPESQGLLVAGEGTIEITLAGEQIAHIEMTVGRIGHQPQRLTEIADAPRPAHSGHQG